jgi:hypothetical protein
MSKITEAEVVGIVIECPNTKHRCQIIFINKKIEDVGDVDGVTIFDCPSCGQTHEATIGIKMDDEDYEM